jgi:hypothetical protein
MKIHVVLHLHQAKMKQTYMIILYIWNSLFNPELSDRGSLWGKDSVIGGLYEGKEKKYQTGIIRNKFII